VSNRNASTDRILGVLGVLGGAVLLLAFVVEIPAELNWIRLVLFFTGSMAVTLALARRAGQGERSMGIVAAVAIALNAASIAMVVLAMGREHPFGGDFGLLWFWVGLATWLADAAVGFVAWRLGTAHWLGPVVLAVGSVLAILGMDRLGLSSSTDITVFGRLGLLGVALNGAAWILLGLDLALDLGRGRSQAVSRA
jgi:hypothetical protein